MKRCIREQNAEFKLLNWNKIKPSEQGFIFWHIVNLTKDMAKEDVISSFEKVFECWQEAFDKIKPEGRVITLQKTKIYDQAHIKLLFVDPHRTSQVLQCLDGQERKFRIPKQFDGVGGTLAYVPINSHRAYFDEGERWDLMGNMQKMHIGLFDTALHEVGHIWDLGHTTVKGAVMEPYYDGTRKQLHKDDIRGLQRSYGKIKANVANG